MDRGAVLTTGANSGIGLATALEVARRGYRSIGSVRSQRKADDLRAAADEAGVEVETTLLDVTDADACAATIDEVGPLYGLVNNAGYSNVGAIEDVDDQAVRDQFETMTIAPMRLARLALPAMREAGTGRIVNVSSIFGRTTTPLTGWYQATKHALEAASDALRMEVAADGVHVVLVQPGGFTTAIWEGNEAAVARHEGSRFADAYEREMRLTRLAQPFMGDPQQVAALIGRILDARWTRARYLIGADAHAAALMSQLTPTALKDRVTRFGFGL